MKNILEIFKGDLRRIFRNTIALIIVIGLSVVPSLYAWFNVAASWDPYGSTGNLTVAVANCDEGYKGELVPIQTNIGEALVSSLRANTKFNWIFVSEKEAVKGVREGSCYAAIVIPESFSRDMMSMFSDDMKKSSIIYYVNQKENAIAPKITSKGADAIIKQVDSSFVGSITDISLNLALGIMNVMEEEDGNRIISQLAGNLRSAGMEVESTAQLLDTYANLVTSLENLLSSSESVLNSARDGIARGNEAIQNADQDLTNASNSWSDVTKTIDEAIQTLSSAYNQIEADIDSAFATADSDWEGTKQRLASLQQITETKSRETQSFRNSLESLRNAVPEELSELISTLDAMIADVKAVEDKENKLAAKLKEAQDTAGTKQGQMKTLQKELKDLAADCQSDLKASKDQYKQQIEPSLSQIISDVQATGTMLTTLLGQLDGTVSNTKELTEKTNTDLKGLKAALQTSASMLRETRDKLNTAADQIGDAETAGDLDTVKQILGSDPNAVSNFLSSPVQLNTQKIYPVDNYGSAMAPFYSVLAIWVGGTCLVAMMKVDLEKKRRKLLKNLKEYEVYLGRYLLFLIMGLIQSTIICLGDLFFLQIQCVSPIRFLLAGWFASIVFVNLIYTLVASFGDVGKAVAVLLMVVQVAGSGGTFPIEMMPKFFQMIYQFLPFTHAMAAIRECIAGFYGSVYWVEMGHLLCYLIGSLIFGLLLRKPLIKGNHMLMEKIEETKLM